MVKLMDALSSTLNKYKFFDILSVIDRKDDSAKYIHKLLKEMNLPEGGMTIKNLKNNLGFRMNHILFTFALGLVLSKFSSLDELIRNDYSCHFTKKKDVFLKVWLITSLYHDFGYFIQDKYSQYAYLNEFHLENNIFECDMKKQTLKSLGLSKDENYIPRYSRDVFESYYHCYFTKKNIDEPIEHGISGGYVLFDKIITKDIIQKKNYKKPIGISKNDTKNIFFYKSICFRIMEHNIWAINPNINYFKDFLVRVLNPLYIENYKKIDVYEPLLMLLSLTDTIEYIKRMSTTGLDNQNAQSRPTTIAKKLQIEIDTNKIIIQFDTEVEKIEGFEKWKKSIIRLKEWISVKTYDNTNKIIIEKI